MKFYNNYVISNINEGTNFCIEKSRLQTQEILNFYSNKPFVYISERVSSYSVNPAIYPESSQIENLVGFAVVSTNNMALENAKIEKLFFKKPFKLFATIKEAIEWVDNLLADHSILK